MSWVLLIVIVVVFLTVIAPLMRQRALVATRLARETGKALSTNVFDRAFSKLQLSSAPDAVQLQQVARQAKALGFLASDDLTLRRLKKRRLRLRDQITRIESELEPQQPA